jgi:hypothetical protein
MLVQQPKDSIGRGVAKQQSDLAGREAATTQAVGLEFQLWALPVFFCREKQAGAMTLVPATPTWKKIFIIYLK